MNEFIIRNIDEEIIVIFNGVYKFELLEHFGNRLIGYSKDNKITFIYENGDVKTYNNFEYFPSFDCIMVENNEIYGVYSRKGIELVPAKFHHISFMANFMSCCNSDKGYMIYKYDGTPLFKKYVEDLIFYDNYFEVTSAKGKRKYMYKDLVS